MKIFTLCLPVVLLVTAGCERTVTHESAGRMTWAEVKGSPEFPYIDAKGGDDASDMLVFTAKHIPTGKVLSHEVRILRDETIIWVKVPEIAGLRSDEKVVFYDDQVGVKVSVDYTEEKNGLKIMNDSATILIPFGEDQSGEADGFRYDASWRNLN